MNKILENTMLTTKRYITLSFQHDHQVIFEAYEKYQPEFDSPSFQGCVSLADNYDPDWYQSDDPNLVDFSINFDWECLTGKCSQSITTYLDNPDELSTPLQITGIRAVTKDLYIVELNS